MRNFITIHCAQIFYATMGQGDFTLACQPISYAATARHRLVPIATYMYFIAKIVDLFDTVFFILRKKTAHVSFLHLYHHSLMVGAMWVACNYVPGGHSWLLAEINSCVHVCMYAYYLLASLAAGDVRRTALVERVKRRVTQVQMVQFVVLAAHYAYGWLREDCGGYPRPALLIGVIQNGFMLVMFGEFYRKNYGREVVADVEAVVQWLSLGALREKGRSLVHWVKDTLQPKAGAVKSE